MEFQKAYERTIRVVVDCSGDVGRTKKSFRDDSDVNLIVAKYRRSGVMDYLNKHAGSFSDVSVSFKLEDAMHTMAKASQLFSDLPANIRRRFDHDPAQFVDFINQPGNRAEAISLGLIPAPPAAPPAVVPQPDAVGGGTTEPKAPASV